MHVNCPPTLTFDPGSKFTAGLLRECTDAIDGFTLALAYPDDPDLNAVLDAHEALRVYTDRITDHAVALWDTHFPGKPVRVVIEAMDRPRKGVSGRHKAGNGGTGNPRDYYPTSLIGARPCGWDVNEAPRGARDHEQAAYTLAGLAELLLKGTS